MRAQQICKEVANDVTERMEKCITFGDDTLYYEKIYGDAMVVVDIYPEHLPTGFVMTITDVCVSHCDPKHESPLLTQAIRESIPDWDTMADRIRTENELYN